MLSCTIAYKPKLFLFNIVPESIEKEKRYLIIHVTTAARILFAKYWKNEATPTIQEFIAKVLEMADINILTEVLKDKEIVEVRKKWESLYNWMRDENMNGLRL